jgi:acylglycerol lipase
MTGRAAIVLAILLLAACTAPTPQDYGSLAAHEDAGQNPAVPRFTADAFVTSDGARLPLRVWRPSGEVKAVILALHGFNDYSNAFAGPGTALTYRGIATYAYDQRGFGAAPLRGRWVGREQLAADVAAASRILRARYPGVPLYLLGESMGGAVATVAMTADDVAARPAVDGLILVAPAVWSRSTMTVFERTALWMGVRLTPAMTVTGQGIIHVHPSDNIAMLRAFSDDPLVIKGTRVDAIYGLVDLMDAALAASPKLEAPLLYLYGEHDEIVPRAPTELMIAHLPPEAQPHQRIAWYANGYHMLMRDLDAAVVVDDIGSWIERRRAPLPSGADLYADQVLGTLGIARIGGAPTAAAD